MSATQESAALLENGHPTGSKHESVEHHPVVIIGAGQSGLSTAYHLKRRGVPFVILDERARVGDVWRERWDSLRLFTPARYNGLDGMRFPAASGSFPTKDEMGDFLETYASRLEIPVRTGMHVDRLTRGSDGSYTIHAGSKRFEAEHVVVAMASYQKPRIPAFASDLAPGLTQLHSLDYRRPSQLPEGDALVVGAGNSGVEIAVDLARAGRRVHISGTSPGEVPFQIESRLGAMIMPIVFRGVFHRVLTVDTPIGRKARPRFITKGTPLIRTRTRDLAPAGIH